MSFIKDGNHIKYYISYSYIIRQNIQFGHLNNIIYFTSFKKSDLIIKFALLYLSVFKIDILIFIFEIIFFWWAGQSRAFLGGFLCWVWFWNLRFLVFMC